MEKFNDLYVSSVSATSVGEFIDEFELNEEYVKLNDVQELLSNIETEVDHVMSELESTVKRFV